VELAEAGKRRGFISPFHLTTSTSLFLIFLDITSRPSGWVVSDGTQCLQQHMMSSIPSAFTKQTAPSMIHHGGGRLKHHLASLR
jgi:hypothetical protein